MAGNTIAVMTVLLLSLSVLQTMGEGDECDCEKLISDAKDIDFERRTLVKELKTSNEKKEELEKDLKDLRTKNIKLQKFVDNHQEKTDDEHRKKTDENDKSIEKLQSKITELKEQNNKLKEDLDNLNKTKHQQEESLKKLKHEIKNVQLQLKQETREVNDTNSKWDTEYKSLQNELDGVRMELNYTKNNYTELRGKCDELQTMNANDTSKNETKNKNDSGKNKNDSGKPTPTKTASTTQHAKVETEKVASVKKTIQGHAIIKTTQKPITKSIVKKSDNFLLYALLAAGSIFAIIIIVYFRKEVTGFAKKCLKDDDKGRPASKNYKKLKSNVEESMDVSNRVKDYIY